MNEKILPFCERGISSFSLLIRTDKCGSCLIINPVTDNCAPVWRCKNCLLSLGPAFRSADSITICCLACVTQADCQKNEGEDPLEGSSHIWGECLTAGEWNLDSPTLDAVHPNLCLPPPLFKVRRRGLHRVGFSFQPASKDVPGQSEAGFFGE